jgi:hypothetical protein
MDHAARADRLPGGMVRSWTGGKTGRLLDGASLLQLGGDGADVQQYRKPQ